MTVRAIEDYAAQVAMRVGEQEAALHHHPLQAKIDRALRKTMRHQRPSTIQTPIDRCATGNCGQPTLGSILTEQHSPWFWLAVGAGVGGLAYMVSRSDFVRNPEEAASATAAEQAAAIAVQAGIPTILWGSPGIGKTSWLVALGRAMDAKVFTVIGSTKDPADIGGMLKPDGTLIPPSWALEIRKRSLRGERSILFLDEFSSMAPLVHAALLRVVREKIAGDCDFDPAEGPLKGRAVHIVCAANPRKEGAAAIDLPPPAANRMIHLEWTEPSALSYGLGLVLGWPAPVLPELPGNWQESDVARSARKLVAEFIKVKPTALFAFPKASQKSLRGRAWPSPRSWEMAADAFGAAQAAGTPLDVAMILVKGAVGEGTAIEFLTWLKNKNLPDPEQILADPTSWTPEEHERYLIHVVGGELYEAFTRTPTPERWDAFWGFMRHIMSTMGSGELYVLIPAGRRLYNLVTPREKRVFEKDAIELRQIPDDPATGKKGQFTIPKDVGMELVRKLQVTGQVGKYEPPKKRTP